jgi:hypothetical protein
MFPPSRLIEAGVFARLTEALRKSGARSERMEIQLAGASPGTAFSKAVNRDGNRYCVEC